MIAISAALAFFMAGQNAAQQATVLEHFPAPPFDGRPAPYSNAVRYGDVLYLAGQTGEGPDGKLPASFDAQARGTMNNIAAILKTQGLGWDDVFKCTVLLDDMANWSKFNEIYMPYFQQGKLPARTAIGADGLAGGALLEVECWARAPKAN